MDGSGVTDCLQSHPPPQFRSNPAQPQQPDAPTTRQAFGGLWEWGGHLTAARCPHPSSDFSQFIYFQQQGYTWSVYTRPGSTQFLWHWGRFVTLLFHTALWQTKSILLHQISVCSKFLARTSSRYTTFTKDVDLHIWVFSDILCFWTGCKECAGRGGPCKKKKGWPCSSTYQWQRS